MPGKGPRSHTSGRVGDAISRQVRVLSGMSAVKMGKKTGKTGLCNHSRQGVCPIIAVVHDSCTAAIIGHMDEKEIMQVRLIGLPIGFLILQSSRPRKGNGWSGTDHIKRFTRANSKQYVKHKKGPA
jgi:hypothetical protein